MSLIFFLCAIVIVKQLQASMMIEDALRMGIKMGKAATIPLLLLSTLTLIYTMTLGEDPKQVDIQIFFTLRTIELAAGTFAFCNFQEWIDSDMKKDRNRKIGILAIIYTLFI
ncbi:hypothetical protein HNV12_01585 [Methanococcoides sp. SA1]|nr:hypothetical protein [Methanococcoides sp. SA1]